LHTEPPRGALVCSPDRVPRILSGRLPIGEPSCRSRSPGPCPDVHPLALRAEQTEELHRPLPRRSEPVRHPGVELGGLPRRQHHVVLAEHQPQLPGQHVQPLVALVRARLRLLFALRFQHLVRLEAAGLAGERPVGAAAPHDRPGPHARVAHRRRPDQLVQRHPVGLRDRQEQLQTGLAQPRLQPGERTDGDAGGLRQRRQRHLPVLPDPPQPGTDVRENFLRTHDIHCRIGKVVCQSRRNGGRSVTEVVTMTETHAHTHYDVVVVGGGAAGLSAALVLGRARLRTLVVDAAAPRNAPSPHMQGYLSRGGMSPAEFLAVGREEVARCGVELVRGRVTDVTRGDGFTVAVEGSAPVRARRLVVATGLKDELPDVPGVAERFGRDVLHRPFCHGWAARDEPFGVLAATPASVHQALMVSRWSKDVTLFLHTVAESELTDQDLRRLAAARVDVVPGEVAGLVVEDDRFTGVRLADGSVHPRGVLYVAPRPLPQTGLLERLGAELDETPFGAYPVVDATGLTTVPGVWAAGNAIGFSEQVIHAASGGYRAAAAIVGDLLMEDLDAAVTP